MRQLAPRAYREEPVARPVERRGVFREAQPAADPATGDGPASGLLEPAGSAGRGSGHDPDSLSEQVVAGARSLAGQMRALQERYEEEHRRLADSLEFLVVQSRDLEREIVAFSRLAGLFESGVRAAAEPSGGRPVGPAPARLHPTAVDGLELRCLGEFSVQCQGRPVDLGRSRKGRLVFKYLATRAPGRRASKELLAELFWPDTPLERALASLQSAVHQLKRAAGHGTPLLLTNPPLVFADHHYELNPRLPLSSDLDRFRRRLLEARVLDARGQVDAACEAYGQAVEAYGGELMPEERYEDWVGTERASLEADLLAVLTRLVQLNLSRAAYAEAIRFGRVLLEVDGTREDVHRDLMRCHGRLGQRSEALRQYRRCFEALAAELEVIPEAATTELFERLARGEAI